VRIERGIALEDAVAALKYAPRQLAALEEDQYGELPAPTVVRGMLRSYAKFLGVDPAPYVEALAASLGVRPPEVIATTMGIPFQTRHKPKNTLWWALSGLVVLALVIFGVQTLMARRGAAAPVPAAGVAGVSAPAAGEPQAMPGGSPSASGLPVPGSSVPDSPVSNASVSNASVSNASVSNASVSNAPVSNASVSDAPVSNAPATRSSPDAAGAPPEGGTAALAAPVAALPAAASSAAPAAPVTAVAGGPALAPSGSGGGAGQISLHAGRDAWIEVIGGGGEVLLRELVRAGTDRSLEGAPPFRLVIGAAQDVTLRYNGQPVSLAAQASATGVARLTLP
jgi:cytoskeleton protein RodZ